MTTTMFTYQLVHEPAQKLSRDEAIQQLSKGQAIEVFAGDFKIIKNIQDKEAAEWNLRNAESLLEHSNKQQQYKQQEN